MMSAINLSSVLFDDRDFVMKKLSVYPLEIQQMLIKEYQKIKGRREANLFLLHFEEQISQKIDIKPSLMNLNHDEDSLRAYAQDRAELCEIYRASFPKHNVTEILDNLTSYAKTYGVSVNVNGNEAGNIKRLCDPQWWLRKLRRSLTRNVEIVHHHLNAVNKFKGIYASDWLAKKRRYQLLRHQESMASTFLMNDHGDTFSLKELSDLSVSNPKIRKAELMVRIRGFEEISKASNHDALFITLTCPSKYHRAFSKSGDANPKWAGFTPLDAQDYLNGIWQRIRAKLDREQIRIYGFRVAEPNHDGTPHWHLLLFVNVSESESLQKIVTEYALMEDGGEKGASEHRCTIKTIDPKKGSATGYIAKYISKNIDGSDLEEGVYGENPIDAAERVNAWASCWGIRQFQQIGGPSVSVWREARRLKAFQTETDQSLDSLRVTADSSNWQEFTGLMGGVFVKRAAQLARPLYDFTVNKETGEVSQNHYDGTPTKSIKGILFEGAQIVTRFLKWTRVAFRNENHSNLEFCQ